MDGLLLSQQGNHLQCDNGHHFDIARQGYVNLLPVQRKKSKAPGDSKAMVDARQRFLDTGLYDHVVEQLHDIIHHLITHRQLPAAATMVDAGCGEGYYSQKLAKAFKQFNITGLDISKEAVKAASKRTVSGQQAIDWVVASNSAPPLQDNSVDLILCIFGFPHLQGFHRILKRGGCLLLVDPAENHLLELRQQIYNTVNKRAVYSVDDGDKPLFSVLQQRRIHFTDQLRNRQQLQDLLLMTPHLFRASAEGKQRINGLTSLPLTVDMQARVLQKN